MEGDPHGPSTLLTISQLSQRIKTLLLDTFADVRVVGELSDVSRPQSGHLYLTLKDANAQIRAVIWRNTARFLDFELSDGQEVACRGEIDVYPPRGSYQLIIRQIEPVGLGQLQQQLKQLQRRLAAEGLFDPAKKRPLPRFPRLVAFVTSPTGAAIHDFLEVVRRRWRGVRVLLIPARVQGAGAAAEIARGIEAANALRPRPDVLVVGRGGGSMEDLWCFNEEVVVRAIEQSVIPTVSAVGHEVDVTLADLAADVRALTPSEAAERVVPSQTDVLAGLKGLESRLSLALRRRANEARLRLDTLANARVMRRPHDRLHEFARILDDLSRRATRGFQGRLVRARDGLAAMAGKLETLSPLRVLGRGYSLTQHDDGRLVTRAGQVAEGDVIQTRVAQGKLESRVTRVEVDKLDSVEEHR